MSALQLRGAPGFGLHLQRLDQRHGLARAEPAHEILHARFDEGLGLADRRHAFLAAGLHDLRKVVECAEVDIGERADLGLDVARHGQVDHQDRPALAGLDRAKGGAEADHRPRAHGARDDHVELAKPRHRLGQADRLRAEMGRERVAPRDAAIRDRELLRRLGSEVREHRRGPLVSAQEQHLELAEVLEQLAREPHHHVPRG